MHLAVLAAGIGVTTYTGLLFIRYGVDLLARLRVLAKVLESKRRVIALPLEGLYVATDPPLRALHKRVPPMRLGSVAFDLGYVVLLVVLPIVNAGLTRLG